MLRPDEDIDFSTLQGIHISIRAIGLVRALQTYLDMRSILGVVLCSWLAGCGGGVSSDDPSSDVGTDGTTDAAIDLGVDGSPPTDSATFDSADTNAPLDAACTDCLGSVLTWGNVGGTIARAEGSKLTPCRTYEHHLDATTPSPPDTTCSQDLAACSSADGIAEVERALADPDMVEAFAAAPITYGGLVPDVGMFVISLDGKQVGVTGADCTSGSPTGCKPTPAGVQRAVDLLKRLDTAQLAVGSCKTVFGS